MKCAQRRTDVCYGNPIIGEIETRKTFHRHRQQLKAIKPSIDTGAPKAQPHLQLFGRDYFARKRAVTEAAFQDLKMIQSIAKTMTRPHPTGHQMVGGGTGPALHASARRKELFRITEANHQLLGRLENLQPVITRQSKMIAEHKTTRLYLANASHSARKNGQYDRLLNNNTSRSTRSIGGAGGGGTSTRGSRKGNTGGLASQSNNTQSMPVLAPPAPAPAPTAAHEEEEKEEYAEDDFEEEEEGGEKE